MDFYLFMRRSDLFTINPIHIVPAPSHFPLYLLFTDLLIEVTGCNLHIIAQFWYKCMFKRND